MSSIWNGNSQLLNWGGVALALCICLYCANVLLLPSGVAAAGGNTATLTPDSNTVAVNDAFDVKVVLTTTEDSDTFGAVVQWNFSADKGRIKCTGVDEGDFFKSHGQSAMQGDTDFDPEAGWTPTYDDANKMWLDRTLADGLYNGTAPAGTGAVFVLHFKAEQSGSVNIKFVPKSKNPKKTDSEVQLVRGGKVLSLSTNDAVITVGGSGSSGASTNTGGTISSNKPDLVFDSVDVQTVSNTSTVTYSVRNRGGVDSGNFRVGLYLDDNQTPTATEDVKSLASGATYSGTFNKYLLQNLGPLDTVKVLADDNKQLDQDSTDKHWALWPPVDLIVSSVTPAWTEQGKTYEINYKVKNIGAQDVDKSQTSITVAGKQQMQECPALASGDEYAGKAGPFTLGGGGSDAIKICADALSQIDETREDNNCQETKWSAGSQGGQAGENQSATADGQTKPGIGQAPTDKGKAESKPASSSAASPDNTVIPAASPLIPETRPATPGITIAWEYIGGVIGLVFLVGLAGYVFGRIMSDRDSDY